MYALNGGLSSVGWFPKHRLAGNLGIEHLRHRSVLGGAFLSHGFRIKEVAPMLHKVHCRITIIGYYR
jgi:hypothetical protein